MYIFFSLTGKGKKGDKGYGKSYDKGYDKGYEKGEKGKGKGKGKAREKSRPVLWVWLQVLFNAKPQMLNCSNM